jgi:ribosome maturation factor RimP
MNLISEIERLIKPSLNPFNVDLYGVSLIMEQGRHILRIELDGQRKPIDLDTIVKISEKLSTVLDNNDLIPHNYLLDVCSSGAERPLDIVHLNEHIDTYIHLHLRRPFKGLNDIEGVLKEVESTSVTMAVKDKAVTKMIKIARDDIDHARMAIKF